MSTKNVFADLGLANDLATVEAWRSDLARIVRDYFIRSQLSQTVFARRVGVKQSVVSRIVNGRLANLSVEFLLRICVKLETRGRACWGPSPDEAFVSTDAALFDETATSMGPAKFEVEPDTAQAAIASVTIDTRSRSKSAKIISRPAH